MRRLLLPVLAVSLVAFGAQAQEEADAHPIFGTTPTVDRLDNGLTIVTVPWPTPGVVAYYTLVEVGSRDEVEPGRSGFAHLFEHMMFRGTRARPGEAYQLALQAYGADTNAYTTDDYTVYVATAPASALPEIVEIEADRFRNLHYDEAAFRTETGAVLGEYNTDASDPGSPMYERLSEMAFTRHTYGHTTMGYLRDVCAMPGLYDYSLQFFERYYTPDNTTVIVVGDVARDALVEQVATHYGAWSGERFDNAVPVEPEPEGGDRSHLVWDGTTPPRAVVGYRVPAFDGNAAEPEARAAAIRQAAALEVVRALAFDESSPLYQRLVVEEQTLLRLSSWPNELSVDPGLFTAWMTVQPSQDFGAPADFDPVLDAIQAELDGIAAGEVSRERIEAVQSHIRYRFLAELETPGRIASTLAHFIAVGGGAEALVEYLDALTALTPDDIASVAATYLVPGRRFVVTVAPAGEGEEATRRPTCADFAAERSADDSAGGDR